MARDSGGDDVFIPDDDRKSFFFRLGQGCASHGWMIHAWVLMGVNGQQNPTIPRRRFGRRMSALGKPPSFN